MTGAGAVVILAAGLGSRLQAGGARPKWLLELGAAQPVARHQLDSIPSGEGAAPVVVTGHGAHHVGTFTRTVPRPRIHLEHDPRFADHNNWYSLLLGLRRLEDLQWRGAVVVLNGDLVAPAAWVADFLAGPHPVDHGVLAVDVQRELTGEAMKVRVASSGCIQQIGKVGVARPTGEYLGLAALTGEAVRAVRAVLEDFVGRPEYSDEWYERAFQLAIEQDVPFVPWRVPGSDWVEIDDHDDLCRATALFATPIPLEG